MQIDNLLKLELEDQISEILKNDSEKQNEILEAIRNKDSRAYRKIKAELNSRVHKDTIFNKAPISTVRLDMLVPNPYQPRKIFDEDDLLKLASSIEQNGLISPILVSKNSENHYIIIAGERRYRATKILCQQYPEKFCEIEAKVINNVSDEKLQILALLENTDRKDLTIRELAESIFVFYDHQKMKIKDIVQITGMSKSKIGRLIQIAQINEAVLSRAEEYNINSINVLEFIASLKETQTQFQALEIYFKDDISLNKLKSLFNTKEENEDDSNDNILNEDDENSNKPIEEDDDDDENYVELGYKEPEQEESDNEKDNDPFEVILNDFKKVKTFFKKDFEQLSQENRKIVADNLKQIKALQDEILQFVIE